MFLFTCYAIHLSTHSIVYWFKCFKQRVLFCIIDAWCVSVREHRYLIVHIEIFNPIRLETCYPWHFVNDEPIKDKMQF